MSNPFRASEFRGQVNPIFWANEILDLHGCKCNLCPTFQPKPEVTIVSNVPAIEMEEVAPVTASDATLLAPEEIQAKSRRPDVGVTEKTSTDRKRERRLKKKQKRLKNSEKKQREKVSGSPKYDLLVSSVELAF